MKRREHDRRWASRPGLGVLELEDRCLLSGTSLLPSGLLGQASSLLGDVLSPAVVSAPSQHAATSAGDPLLGVLTRDVGQVVGGLAQTVTALAPVVSALPLGGILAPVARDVGAVVGGLAPVVSSLGDVVSSTVPLAGALPLGNVVGPLVAAAPPVVQATTAAVPGIVSAVSGPITPVQATIGAALPAAGPSITLPETLSPAAVGSPTAPVPPAAPAVTVPTAGASVAEFDGASALAVAGPAHAPAGVPAQVLAGAVLPALQVGLAVNAPADAAADTAIVSPPGLASAAEAVAMDPALPPGAGDEPLPDRFSFDLAGLVPGPAAMARAFEGLEAWAGAAGSSAWLAWLAAAALAVGAGEITRRQLRLNLAAAANADGLLPPGWRPEDDLRL